MGANEEHPKPKRTLKVRLSARLDFAARHYAATHGMSMDALVVAAVAEKIDRDRHKSGRHEHKETRT